MAKRTSNKERIQRRALEAAVKEEEKTGKKTTKKAGKKAAKAGASKTVKKKATRLKIVWIVFDERFKEIKTFPYGEKEAAEATAAKLTEKSGKRHFVNPVKVPADDE